MVCWSVKGGVGTTVVTAMLALRRAVTHAPGVLALDLAGDLGAVLGVPPQTQTDGSNGFAEWLAADPDVGIDALNRVAFTAADGLELVDRGRGPLVPIERVEVFAAAAATGTHAVVVDAGRLDGPDGEARRTLAAAADLSLMVTRPCYLSLRRAAEADLSPSGLVVVREPGRALDRHDVEDLIRAPVVLELDVDIAIARAVDAGLLHARLPRSVVRLLDRAA